jgi:hypothetical protein
VIGGELSECLTDASGLAGPFAFDNLEEFVSFVICDDIEDAIANPNFMAGVSAKGASDCARHLFLGFHCLPLKVLDSECTQFMIGARGGFLTCTKNETARASIMSLRHAVFVVSQAQKRRGRVYCAGVRLRDTQQCLRSFGQTASDRFPWLRTAIRRHTGSEPF